MKIDGVWGVEVHGLHGWDPVSTAILEKGRYFTASANHFSIGSYKKDKDKFSAKVRVIQYGEPSIIFGEKSENFDAVFKGKIEKKGTINGRLYPSTGKNLDVNVRMTRLEKLD
jgi:hypothetical protein